MEWELLCAVVLGVLVLLYLYYKFSYAPYQLFIKLHIPGPSPTPFFGNFLQTQKHGLLDFEKAVHRQYGSVSGYYVGKLAVLMLSDISLLKEVLVQNFQSFKNRREMPKMLSHKLAIGLAFAQGETWKIRKSLVTPSFTASKMKLMIPIIQRSVNTLVEILGEAADTGKSVNIHKLFASFTIESILATAFGKAVAVQRGEADIMTKASADMFERFKGNIFFTNFLLSNFPWLDNVLTYFMGSDPPYMLMKNISLELVKKRRNEEKGKYKDLLQLLLNATLEENEGSGEGLMSQKNQNSSKLTDEEVVIICIEFIMAGYETTANTMAYISYLLALNPDVQENLRRKIQCYYCDNSVRTITIVDLVSIPPPPFQQIGKLLQLHLLFNNFQTATLSDAIDDIKYLDMVIQEALRLYTVGPRLLRICNRETYIGGYQIPKGCNIVIPVHILHEDPKYWPEPHKFDPLRFTAEERAKRPQLCHLPFGMGPRSCVGMRFALLEIKMVFLELMKKRFSFVRAPDTEVPPKMNVGLTLSPINGIKLNITKLL